MLLNEKLKKEYGAIEYNAITENYHNEEIRHIHFDEVLEKASEGEKIISERLRFVTDSYHPYYDLSYWHVRIKGTRYRVYDSPFEQIIKKGGLKRNIYKIVKEKFDGVFISNLFDNISVLY